MPLRDLAEWVLENPTFRERFRRLVIEAAQAELPDGARLGLSAAEREPHDWSYLLLVASVLATATDQTPEASSCHDAALRIAQHCLAQPRERSEHGEAADMARGSLPNEVHRAAAANVLSQLANRPALRLAAQRALLPASLESRLPLPARIEWLRRQLEDTVALSDDELLAVNRFQRRLWTELEQHDWVSFSAPTSAGKSFILTRWVIDFMRRRPEATIVYLVPTRALISQVEADLTALVHSAELPGIVVSTLPLPRSARAGRSNVLVLTQERLHILLIAVPGLAVDVVIVDEAHKVGDGHRGVLLQQVIERVVGGTPDTKVIFASPMTRNPEVLVTDAPLGRRRQAFTSREVTVSQNLIWVSQVPRMPREWTASLCLPDEVVPIGTITLGSTPDGERKKLAYVAYALSQVHTGNVLYVNGAADAEHVALLLYDLLGGDEDAAPDPELAALIDLTRRTVHRQFALARVLARGVAFHYGNMPLLIRTEVERLFSEGIIRYLVCTSTLIEGVNMSCRTIFVRGPTKGRGRPMGAEDFWNLAGRAGRWGKEFQGNVVCIDADRTAVWGEDGPPRARRLYAITRTADRIIAQPDELIAFIEARTPRALARRRPDLEFTYAYLMAQQLRHGTVMGLPWIQRLDSEAVRRVSDAVTETAATLRTPVEVVERNPGISPLAMDSLLARFARPNREDPAGLLPVEPASNDAVEVYRSVIGRIAGELNAGLGPAGPRSHALALLITRWMSGLPLSRLIAERERWEREHNTGRSLAAIIRLVLNEVEQIARFEAPRSLACYTDLLRVHYQQIDRPDLESLLRDDFHMMLEFGVSIPTQVSMIGLGLSRTSAVMLGALITDDQLDEAGALAWLRGDVWRTADLPALVVAEIERVLGFHLTGGTATA